MLKKTITYKDFDDNERTEDFYFNITKAEAIEFRFSEVGGLEKLIEKVVNEKDEKKTIEIFKDFILRSYGEKSPDGKRFIKSKELTDAFVQTNAYSILFTELATNDDEAVAFVNGIIPQE